MPELPEVEVLVRRLGPLVRGRRIRSVTVRRPRVLRAVTARSFARALRGATFVGLRRRGKFLVFTMRRPRLRRPFCLLAHLGMTGRIYGAAHAARWPKHAAVVFDLGQRLLVCEDPRYFGRWSLQAGLLRKLGPEPLGRRFTIAHLETGLKKSRQAIKVRLLDQRLVAGLGNIYASEALHVAGLSPRRRACGLRPAEVARLHRAIRGVLAHAIRGGSTVPLGASGWGDTRGGFYRDGGDARPQFYRKRLRVYDRAGRTCRRCGGSIRRIVQAGRSTYFCPRCQH